MTDLEQHFRDNNPAQAERLEELRQRILAVAKDRDVEPIEETLKWGQPSLVPPKRDGTTLRLGTREGLCVLYVHCQTNLVEQWRSLFRGDFEFEDNRAVLIPADGTYNTTAFDQIAAMALCYHRDKRA